MQFERLGYFCTDAHTEKKGGANLQPNSNPPRHLGKNPEEGATEEEKELADRNQQEQISRTIPAIKPSPWSGEDYFLSSGFGIITTPGFFLSRDKELTGKVYLAEALPVFV